MKLFRFLFFSLLICGIIAMSLILMEDKPQPPFSRSLLPFFQELGKPVKSVDRAVTRMLPIDEIDEAMLGDEIKASLKDITTAYTPEEESTARYLNALAAALTEESRKPFQYEVFLIDGLPNACAFPGGVLCITKSFMDLLENEAELVAVLAHEIGHIERGHTFDAARGAMLRHKTSIASVAAFASDILHSLGDMSFSKSQEDEADDYGFQMLLKKGYDPVAQSTSFEKLLTVSEKKQGMTNPIEDFTVSHPYLELRIEKARSRAERWKQNHPKEKRHLGKKNFKDQITVAEARFSEATDG